MSQLTLYTSEICPYAQRTRIVLDAKAVEHTAVEIDLDNKPGWFLALTPTQRVPVIRQDDFLLWESATVNEYIDASFDGVALRPKDERARAVMRNEIKHFDSVFLATLYKLLFEQDAISQQVLREENIEGLKFLEHRLGEIQGAGPYWMGTTMSLADAAMWPFFERIKAVFSYYRGLEIPSECKRLLRWFDVVAEHPSVRLAAHDADYFLPLYTNYASGAAQGLSAQTFRSGAAN
ncbi:MAG: glutathione S-transferase family protein [Proteobacteria bacterium]|nr:glutathione S-transferase family protein [Pseudomonadota bacterium]